MSVPGLQDAICESGTDTFFERFRFSFVLGLPLSCDFAFRLSLCHQQGHSRGLPVDYRSEGRLIQSPPGRGSEPCRFNPESRVTGGVCLRPSECGFSLIVRLVREVIKITRGVLARVFFWGFGGWNRGRFWVFLLLSRKARERARNEVLSR